MAPGDAGLDRAAGRADELELLRRRHDLLAEAQAIARIGSWEWDAATGVITWSEEMYRVFGVDPATYSPRGHSMATLLHPEDRDRFLGILEGLERAVSGELPGFEGRLAPGPGRTRWIRVRGSAVFDGSGRMLRLHGTAQDITESKDQENALAFLSVMAGLANDSRTLREALVAFDERVRPYTFWPAQLVGLRAEVEGAPLTYLDVARPAMAPQQQAAARALADRVETERSVVEGTSSSGTVMLAGPVVSDGRLACVLVVDTLGADAPLPFERACFTQTLAMLTSVAEREWSARALAEARDQALSGSRAKSEFLATMSHEIRTPLNGVIGLTELLVRTELDDRQRRLAEGVEQAGRSLLALVNDVLDLSKIEAGRLELEEIDFDPAALVCDSVSLVAGAAEAKGLRLDVSCSPALPALVRGDPTRLGQVVTNLVSNAVKFTSVGQVDVRVLLERGDALRVEVRDTGVGVAPQVQERLFRPFTQADSSTTRRFGGTGLGLAICHRLVTAMGGEIGLSSEPGAGSTFWFTARLRTAADADAVGVPGRSSTSGAPTTERVAAPAAPRGARVLVVEDNAVNQMVAEGLLAQLGYEVATAGHGQEALDLLAGDPRGFDAVLMDCQMPVLDGYAATRAIRLREGPGERLPVIAMTAAAVAEERERCLAAGMDDYLTKPVDVAAMGRTLARWVGPGERVLPPA